MNVIGLIAEYNPFHNGHLYQINRIKKIYPNSILIVILNGNFTQRADTSLINKWDKTKILLENNVDLVISLPTFYGINNADIFASGALEILNDLKIDTLIFGSELDDTNLLIDIVKAKINNPKYNDILKEYLKKGYSYPKSSSKALSHITKKEIVNPNDILALSYIECIIKNNYNIKPVSIKRENNYHNKLLESGSASGIREALKNKKDINDYVPKCTLKYLNNPIFIDDYFDLLKYKIVSIDDINVYHDVIEGLDKRIKKYINESNNLEELILKIKTKRYTYSRIKRILLYILLDLKKEDTINIKNYIRPLGFNNTGLKYLNSVKKHLTLPLISNYKNNKDILSFEYKVNAIYSLKNNSSYKDELNAPIKTP